MISIEDRARRARGYRTRYIESGRCMACGGRPARPGLRTCETCAERNATYEKDRRSRWAPAVRGPHTCSACSRTGHNRRSCPGLPAMPSDSPPRPCARCTAITAAGEALCAAHIATFAELARDRAAGRGIDIDEEGDE